MTNDNKVLTTEQALLLAIKADPEADDPRLAYADWLQEFGDCDRDAATDEYIRKALTPYRPKSGKSRKRSLADALQSLQDQPYITLPGGNRVTLPPIDNPPTREWLKANWRRLLPEFVAVFGLEKATVDWKGKVGKIVVPVTAANGNVYTCSCALVFSRGFLTDFGTWGSFAAGRIGPHLADDQPLARLSTGTVF